MNQNVLHSIMIGLRNRVVSLFENILGSELFAELKSGVCVASNRLLNDGVCLDTNLMCNSISRDELALRLNVQWLGNFFFFYFFKKIIQYFSWQKNSILLLFSVTNVTIKSA